MFKGSLRTRIKLVRIVTVALLFNLRAFALASDTQQIPQGTPGQTWSELFQREPYPYTLPLPPPKATPIDGTYTKFETKESLPVPCRRCPDYAPEGGIWKVNFNKGSFRIFHKGTGWKDLGSFFVSGDRLILANDPVCHEIIGVYRWHLEEGKLILKVIDDPCAIALRAMNLTKLPWLSCQPASQEAAITDHWPKPPGCDE